jgi:hypothetical protein
MATWRWPLQRLTQEKSRRARGLSLRYNSGLFVLFGGLGTHGGPMVDRILGALDGWHRMIP